MLWRVNSKDGVMSVDRSLLPVDDVNVGQRHAVIEQVGKERICFGVFEIENAAGVAALRTVGRNNRPSLR